MMQYKDYYKILGISHQATQEEVKYAYRQCARQYHPDVSCEQNAEKRFKEIREAYEVLRNPKKRIAYDKLKQSRSTGNTHWKSKFGFAHSSHNTLDFKDFFETLFGKEWAPETQSDQILHIHGTDQYAKLNITLEEAYHGIQRRVICLPVPEVDFSGHTVIKQRILNLTIPAGVIQGQQVRLAGQGTQGQGGGYNGDLYLEIELESHDIYQVDHKDVYLNLPIAPWEAALGSTVNVSTLGGKVDVKIPPGLQSGQTLRLKGRGLPGQPPGDQYIVIQIVVPVANTDAAQAFYRKMEQELPFDPRLNRVRD